MHSKGLNWSRDTVLNYLVFVSVFSDGFKQLVASDRHNAPDTTAQHTRSARLLRCASSDHLTGKTPYGQNISTIMHSDARFLCDRCVLPFTLAVRTNTRRQRFTTSTPSKVSYRPASVAYSFASFRPIQLLLLWSVDGEASRVGCWHSNVICHSVCRPVSRIKLTIVVTDVDQTWQARARVDPVEVINFWRWAGPGYGFRITFPFLSPFSEISISHTVISRFLRYLVKWLTPTREWIQYNTAAIRRKSGFESWIKFGPWWSSRSLGASGCSCLGFGFVPVIDIHIYMYQ